jgi:chorismate dehydratase
VSYLNTKPLIYGLENGPMAPLVELTIDYPARVAEMLRNGSIDVGLVPVAALPKLTHYRLISDYCIGCDGSVASVGLFSEMPVSEIETILLDYQSRTSAALLKVLLKEYWHISPELIPAYPGYEKDIKGTTGGLVIGDRAFRQKQHNKYMYDLGEAWKLHTKLPFVFAAWTAVKELPAGFEQEFNAALAMGFDHLPEIIAQYPDCPYPLDDYFGSKIVYRLNDSLRAGLQLFLNKISAV